MVNQTLTITIEDDGQALPFSAFAKVACNTVKILRGLDAELAEDHKHCTKWNIIACSMNSPMAITLQAEPLAGREPCDVIGPLLGDVDRLEQGEPPHYLTPDLQQLVKRIVGALGEGLSSIKYAGNGTVVKPTQKVAAHVDELSGPIRGRYTVMTELEGRIESISIHGKAHEFRIYDPLTQRAIKCIFDENDLNSLADLIKNRARIRVLGEARYSDKHRPISIEVRGFKRLPEQNELPQIADLHQANIDITEGVDSVEFIRGLRDAS